MKKRTSSVSRRIVSLLMSMVLTLTLVTPAAFATEVVDGSGTTIVEGNTNPADANPSEDAEGGDSEDEDGKGEQPAESDEDKDPSEDDEMIADEEDADDDAIYDVQEDTLLGISLYAATDPWDGVSTVVVEPNAEGIYEISTGAQLAWLAQQVNNKNVFSGETVMLTADINLGEQEWTPIGVNFRKNGKSFQGTFDGNGHIVTGLKISSDNADNMGLFGPIYGSKAIVKNLIVDGNVNMPNHSTIGGIVANNNGGTVQNCGFYGVVEGWTSVGGVVGSGNAVNCWYYYTGTDEEYSRSVCGGAATNCYTNVNTEQTGVTVVTAEQFKGAATVGETGKTVAELLNDTLPNECMNWLQGVDYPAFIKPVIKWDGTSTEKVVPNAEGIYEISTGAQLAWLAAQVNNKNVFSGKTVMLTADIDLGEQEWTPIGVNFRKNGKSFQGTFDGNGHIVTGLKISSGDAGNMGLFGPIYGSGAIVKDLIVEGNVNMPNQSTIGGIVANNSGGTVQNCGFYGVVEGWTSVGGVVGSGNAVNCWYYYTGTDEEYSRSVCGGAATNCYTNVNTEQTGVTVVTAEQFKGTGEAESLVSLLNKNVPGDCMNWAQGADYPVFATGGTEQKDKTISLIPLFSDCEFVASVKGEGVTYDAENNIYTISANTSVVRLMRSDGKTELWVTTKEDGTEASSVSSSEDFTISGTKTTLYYGTKDDFDTIAVWNSALGRSGKTATIKDAVTLKALARMVNSGKDEMTGKTITLGADIDLNSELWTPIGKADHSFKGTFNGRNGSTYYTIFGLNGDLFGVVNGTIQYVTIDGGAGRIVGTLESGTVQYCMSTAKVTGSTGGLVGQNSGTVSSCYYYNDDSINTPVVGGSGTVKNCFYLVDSSTFGEESDTGARTADEFKLGRVAYELGASSSVWVYDTTKAEKTPQLGSSSTTMTMAAASELKLTKPDNQPEDVVVTLGSSDKKVLTDVAGNQYYYAASGYIGGVSDVPVTFTAPKGYQIVFAPAATQVGGKDYLRITGSNVEYTYSLVKADIRWYESAGAEKNYVLKSADELMGFCLLANGSIDGVSKNFNGWTLSLGNNIDLENSEWKPIPRFAGAFDGKGYEITGLNVNYTGGDFNSKTAGMFEKLVSPGQILNLAVSGSVQAAGKLNYVGGIVGTTESGSEIRFCRSNIAVKVGAANSTTNGMAYGGVAGKVQGAISNCLNEGTITVDNIKNKCYIGGVAGQVGSAADLCWNTGSVTASSTANKNIYTGGIVGHGAATNCYNNGSVTGATGKNKYVTGGISGNGNVTNSYNLGAVSGQGAAGITGKGTVANSYYVCKLNDSISIKMAYVNATEIPVTLGTDGKTYMVGEKKLVDVLNDEHGTNELWFTNPEKNVYLPRHATKWDGETDTDCTFKTITVTYDPNGGVNKDGSNTPVTVSEMVYVVGEDVVTPAKHTVLAADAENLGFKHENGTFNSWKDSNGTKHTAGDIITGITTSITLYAQWDKIWMGEGSANDPYQIFNAEKLTALQTQVNDQGFTYDGKWFKLTDSISLTGNWTPIGTPMAFAGSLDGNGKTIDGLNVNVASGNAGLFASASGGTFKNLKLSGTVNGAFYAGGLIGGGSGVTLDNIEANVTVSGGSYTGGLVGRLLGTLPATAERTPDISNCTVHGSVIGRRYVGGIATSSSDNSPKIENCHNYASITSTGTGTNNASAAGIWSCNTHSANGKFINCTNNGAVTAQKYAAGIATAGTAVIGCVNSNAVVSNNGLSGGISNNAFTVERCGNVGSITGCKSPSEETGVAGIDNYGQNVLYCYNTGVVTCDNEMWAYGISANGRSKIRNSFSYVAGKDLGLTPNLPNVEVTNSYYLASSATAVSSAGEYATLADFASGKVAWGVDGGTGAHANYWTQGANNYPVPIGEGTSTSYYRAKAECGTGGAVSIKSSRNFTGDADNAVYGPKGMSVTVTATPKDDTFGLKSLTLDLMGTGSTTALESGDGFTLGEANALVVATFASTGNGGSGGGTGGNGGDGDGTGTDTGDGAGDENDEGLQDGLNLEVEYDVKSLILSAYGAWGAESSGKTFAQWLKDSPEVLRALITNSLDNMAVAAMGKKTDEAKDLAALLLASLNEHSGLDGQSSDTIGKMLRKYIESGTEAAFSAWLTTGGGMASGTYESIFAQYTNSLLALADRLYTNWESSGTSLTFPQWLDAQQVTMESLSENAEEPDAEPDDTQTTEAPEDVPDGQEAEGGASSGGNSVWEVIGTVVRENPIIVWSIVAVIAALVIVGAVRRYHKVKRDERDDVSSKK